MQSRCLLRSLLTLVASISCAQTFAQSEASSLKDFYIETRFAYEAQTLSGNRDNANTGFKGQWLNLRLDGQISDKLSYSYRQRLNKNTSATFFDSTDWLHLDWKLSDEWTLSAGKQVVAIGGFEYDKAPIDLYYCSEFWNNIPCYQFGVSASYNLTGSDQALFQVCNSPLSRNGITSYPAFNLMWYGRHGFWQTMWSVNMLKVCDRGWMNYISLGNRFDFTDDIHLDVDIMNRYDGDSFSNFLFEDFSIMTEFSANVSESLRLFAKYTFDQNENHKGLDYLVMKGTHLSRASLGFEWNNTPSVKTFCVAGYGWGKNTNLSGNILNDQFRVQAGVKFRLDILSGFANR